MLFLTTTIGFTLLQTLVLVRSRNIQLFFGIPTAAFDTSSKQLPRLSPHYDDLSAAEKIFFGSLNPVKRLTRTTILNNKENRSA